MEITQELKDYLAGVVRDATDKSAELAADKAVKSLVASLPATNAGGVQVTHDPADNPFKSLAEQCQAVKSIYLRPHSEIDPRLKRLDVKATGASEAMSSEGGYLLEPTFSAEVLKPLHEEGPYTRMARKLPVGTNSNSGWINGVDETTRVVGSRWGGIRGYRLAEGGTATASKPKFRRINWELKKYAVLVYGTDELLMDAAQFSTIVRDGASEELKFMANDDILNGDALGGPAGILNSGALISVAAETGQVAATIVNENLLKMYARLDGRSKARLTWFINTDCYPQLHALSLTAGLSALEPRFVAYAPNGALTIFGKPVVETEFNATLGTVGDIVAADMSEYLYWEKGGEQAASSIHVQFLTDETVFRFIYRCDGQTSMASALTPYKGSNTTSAFVALATRS